MFKRKRKVGRPSNASIRREKAFKIFLIVGIFSIFGFKEIKTSEIKLHIEKYLLSVLIFSKVKFSS